MFIIISTYFVSFLFMLFWFTPFYKYLRNSNVYFALLFLSFLPIIYLAIRFTDFTFIPQFTAILNPLSNLLLYKLFDNIILKKYKRHIYFYRKYSTDIESIESTWLEFLFQMILFSSPLLLAWLGKSIL